MNALYQDPSFHSNNIIWVFIAGFSFLRHLKQFENTLRSVMVTQTTIASLLELWALIYCRVDNGDIFVPVYIVEME